jgi:ubiquinone/menaquinone biosynthesis C-methylase UbiE
MHRDFPIYTAALEQITGLAAAIERELGPNALGFLRRVYRGGLARYRARLEAVGLAGRGHVLDAGCGVGQWSLALACDCGRVTGIDVARERAAVCRLLAQAARRDNAGFVAGSLEQLPFAAGGFDGAISYSVLYFTDYTRAIAEIGRVLRPGGLFYLSTNGIGRYLYDVIRNPFPAADFNPRAYGLRSLANTLLGRRVDLSARSGSAAMSPKGTVEALRSAGFEIVAWGPEGSLGKGDGALQMASYWGITAVFDVLARKP